MIGGAEIERDLLEAVAAAPGHFVYESGHHGDLRLDLDGLLGERHAAPFLHPGDAGAGAVDTGGVPPVRLGDPLRPVSTTRGRS